ncbi:MAG: zinc-dependent peptidase [Bacteroidales bacterium]|nr:zinc-dependent peptidase [Bacteroidales bacterium]
MEKILGAIIILGGLSFLLFIIFRKKKWLLPTKPFPPQWRIILLEKVRFYNNLNTDEKKHFEYEIQEFLLNCRITGIKTSINDTDKLLIASSAVIPIFAFPEWKYYNLDEILVYPDKFSDDFKTEGKGRQILGMVGTGYMEGKMILSKIAIHQGFMNENDRKNTAIHEFVHLIDKSDGATDGIPELLLDKQYIIPWIDLIQKKIAEINDDKSDINPYGATKQVEFFAVISEYFFESPKLLQKKHPDIYDYMVKIFGHKMTDKVSKNKSKIGRNDLCPCGSGEKFKNCCGK